MRFRSDAWRAPPSLPPHRPPTCGRARPCFGAPRSRAGATPAGALAGGCAAAQSVLLGEGACQLIAPLLSRGSAATVTAALGALTNLCMRNMRVAEALAGAGVIQQCAGLLAQPMPRRRHPPANDNHLQAHINNQDGQGQLGAKQGPVSAGEQTVAAGEAAAQTAQEAAADTVAGVHERAAALLTNVVISSAPRQAEACCALPLLLRLANTSDRPGVVDAALCALTNICMGSADCTQQVRLVHR